MPTRVYDIALHRALFCWFHVYTLKKLNTCKKTPEVGGSWYVYSTSKTTVRRFTFQKKHIFLMPGCCQADRIDGTSDIDVEVEKYNDDYDDEEASAEGDCMKKNNGF